MDIQVRQDLNKSLKLNRSSCPISNSSKVAALQRMVVQKCDTCDLVSLGKGIEMAILQEAGDHFDCTNQKELSPHS